MYDCSICAVPCWSPIPLSCLLRSVPPAPPPPPHFLSFANNLPFFWLTYVSELHMYLF